MKEHSKCRETTTMVTASVEDIAKDEAALQFVRGD